MTYPTPARPTASLLTLALASLHLMSAAPARAAAPSSALVPPPVATPPVPGTSLLQVPAPSPAPGPSRAAQAPATSPAAAVQVPATSAGASAVAPRPRPPVQAPTVSAKPSPFIPLDKQTGPAGAARVAEAREHFGRGVQQFKDGGLEAALAEFTRAYELAPSYRLHFNIAQVQYELRNYVEAKRSFQRYLAEADSDLPGDRRALVESELQKLDRLVAQFSVKTSVPGVQIAVDGIPAGLVAQGNLVLVNTNPGVRRVSAAKMGFLPASMVVTVTPGERRKLVFELAPVALASAAPDTSASLASAPPAHLTASAEPARPRTELWASVGTTATLAVATGVMALLTRNANQEFDRQLGRVPNDPGTVDDARSRMTRYALIADVLAGATAVATGVSLYFALTGPGHEPLSAATAGYRGRF